jgi:hypothetical protein
MDEIVDAARNQQSHFNCPDIRKVPLQINTQTPAPRLQTRAAEPAKLLAVAHH